MNETTTVTVSGRSWTVGLDYSDWVAEQMADGADAEEMADMLDLDATLTDEVVAL